MAKKTKRAKAKKVPAKKARKTAEKKEKKPAKKKPEPPKKRKRRTKAEMEAARKSAVVEKSKTKKKPLEPEVVLVEPEVKKRKRRTKAEIAAAKEIAAPKKRKRRTKEEIAQDRIEKKVNGDPVFTAGKREKLPLDELRIYLREKYSPNIGLRIADYILQLCDECEHLEIQLAQERMITKTLSETLKS